MKVEASRRKKERAMRIAEEKRNEMIDYSH
jgi:hypothetical protein